MLRTALVALAVTTSCTLAARAGGHPARADVAAGAAPRSATALRHLRRSSCYGPGLYGRHTASGAVLHESTLGVAMHHGLGRRVTLSFRGHRVTVRVIDHGPYAAGRTVDVTAATARRLGFPSCAAFGERLLRTSR